MIDWLTALVGYNASNLRLNTISEVSPDGEVVSRFERRAKVEGSYSSTMQVGRAAPTLLMSDTARERNFLCSPEVLSLSGNPVKFLQGHNVFGPSVKSMGAVVQGAVRAFPEDIRPIDADSPLFPVLHRSRVDITTLINLGSDKEVHEWIHTAATSTRSRHKVRTQGYTDGLCGGETVYWGQTSTRWSLKAYCKFCELRKHKLKLNEVQAKALSEYCEGLLRVELSLRRPELKDRDILDENLIWEYFAKVEVGVMKPNVSTANLDWKLESTLKHWLSGVDLRQRMPKATFYRHRRELLDIVGVDISLKPTKEVTKRSNFDIEYLRRNEVKEIPMSFQELLYQVPLQI